MLSRFSHVEARLVETGRDGGPISNWMTIDDSPGRATFSGSLTAPAGGWYQLEVRTFDGERLVSEASVERVGVGEVFVTAGQSNAANFGVPAMAAIDLVSAFSYANGGTWQQANDPQPGANGSGGSPWPALGELPANEFDVPIGFASVAVGGTRVDQWQPGGSLYLGLENVLSSLGNGGVRAILWHQGESDASQSTSTDNYAELLNNVITASRVDAGFDVPWGVAQVAFLPNNSASSNEAILAAQQQVIVNDPLAFPGPYTDDLIGPTWRHDGIHFNEAGLREHAQRWFNPIMELVTPLTISGQGETYWQMFDTMATRTGQVLPQNWSAEDSEGLGGVDNLGLTDRARMMPEGIVNVGGHPHRFVSSQPGVFIPTWQDDLDGSGTFDDADVIQDGAEDRSLGISRKNEEDPGVLSFQIEITDRSLRALVFDWDIEIWGGSPRAMDRGEAGGGFHTTLSIGGTTYQDSIVSHWPGDLLHTISDGAPRSSLYPSLIDGNANSQRGLSSNIIEVNSTDGAVGNTVNLTFDANFGDHDKGWISAIDNVRLRTLAPGDADANGVVDVADLLTLLAGQKFNQGVSAVTWAQGDFNADDQFNTDDLISMLAYLSGQFPSDSYASEAGAISDAVADVIVNSETGEVTVDLAGHTVSAIIIESAAEIFNGEQPDWDTTSQFPSTLPGELGNVLFTSTASGVDELGVVIGSEFLGRDKEFYLADLDLNILIASDSEALTKGNVIVVPEPSTWLLLVFGSLALVGVLRRRVTD